LLLMLVVMSQMLPGSSILIPLFQVIRAFGLLDTHVGMVLIYTGFAIPFCTWLLNGYFRAIPTDLEQAALEAEASREKWMASGEVDSQQARAVNQLLIGLEKAWLNDRGLQGRPWSRSLYVSPDPFSGYASWMLPGLRYEIEARDRADLPAWKRVYVSAVEELRDRMQEIARMVTAGEG